MENLGFTEIEKLKLEKEKAQFWVSIIVNFPNPPRLPIWTFFNFKYYLPLTLHGSSSSPLFRPPYSVPRTIPCSDLSLTNHISGYNFETVLWAELNCLQY